MNPNALDPEEIRRLLISQPEGGVTRGLSLLISAAFLIAVLNLVRRGRLREEYTPIWTFVAFGILCLSIWFDGLRLITRAVGAWTPASTLFFFGVMFLLVVCLNYAVRLSALSLQVKLLAQEVAILRAAQRPAAARDGEDGPGRPPERAS